MTEIRARITNMIVISEKFTRDMNEAAESYKTKSSEENSSKEESPKENSPERNTSTTRKNETRKQETLKDQDVKEWDVSTEKLIDEDEIERMRIDLELRKIRRLERSRSVEEIESIKSEDLNSVKSEDLIRDAENDILKAKNQEKIMEEMQKQINEEKYRRIKEKVGDEIDKEIMNERKDYNELMLQIISKLEEKKSLTEEETETLEIAKTRKENYERVDTFTIERIYDEIFKKEEEKLSENSELKQTDEELFQERYNRKRKSTTE